jgi:hypothetical protein
VSMALLLLGSARRQYGNRMPRAMEASIPRHNHPLQPRLPIIAARAIVEDRDPEHAEAIAGQQSKKLLSVNHLSSALS